MTMQQKYDTYRIMYEEQQEIIDSAAYDQLIAASMPKFPQLQSIAFSNVGRCKHMLSERFIERYTGDCALQMEADTTTTKRQLQAFFLPPSPPSMTSFTAHVISPKFFSVVKPAAKIVDSFRNLKHIELGFRLERQEAARLQEDLSDPEKCYSTLAQGCLHSALAVAHDLEELTINFEDFGYYGPCVNLKHIIGATTWPNLKFLHLDCLATNAEQLMATLKRHTNLATLKLGFVVLGDGLWPDVIDSMRSDLEHLDSFYPHGVLEDGQRLYAMDHINANFYLDHDEHYTMAEAITDYIDHGNHQCCGNDENPLLNEDFGDEDELEGIREDMDWDDDDSLASEDARNLLDAMDDEDDDEPVSEEVRTLLDVMCGGHDEDDNEDDEPSPVAGTEMDVS